MRLTVLGSSASYAGAGQACASHLIEHDGTSVLFDLGHGALSNLLCVADPLTLDAIVITHEHVDHFADIYALQALLRYAPEGPSAPLHLLVPEGLFARMACLLSSNGQREFAEAFVVEPLVDKEPMKISGITLTPQHVDHTDSTFALIAEAGGARMCYTADTAPGAAVEDVAAGCDLLLAEATLPNKYEGMVPHLTARQAGQIAQRAGASALVLTHIWPSSDRDKIKEDARVAFGGSIKVAEEFDTFEIAR